MKGISMVLYNNYSNYLKTLYAGKVYKLPIALPVTCPNRDGNKSYGGCSFCGEIGAGYENLPQEWSVKEQIEQNKAHIVPKYKPDKFIAYLQNFTNTYLPVERFEQYVREACEQPDIVRVAISTRPDCINQKYLEVLKKISTQYSVDISIELGLQTVNYHTLQKINRGHTLAEYIDAMQWINKYEFYSCTHMILNLPGNDICDTIESAKIVSALHSKEVKLHALYIVKGTQMAQEYLAGEIDLIGLDEYIERVVTFLEYLNPSITIQRLIGRAPASHTLVSNWNTGWWKIRDMIEDKMRSEGRIQGGKFDYLGGSALNVFK